MIKKRFVWLVRVVILIDFNAVIVACICQEGSVVNIYLKDANHQVSAGVLIKRLKKHVSYCSGAITYAVARFVNGFNAPIFCSLCHKCIHCFSVMYQC